MQIQENLLLRARVRYRLEPSLRLTNFSHNTHKRSNTAATLTFDAFCDVENFSGIKVVVFQSRRFNNIFFELYPIEYCSKILS